MVTYVQWLTNRSFTTAVEPCTGRAAWPGPAHSGRAGLYNFEKPSGRAGPKSFWAGPDRAGQHTARKVLWPAL